MKIIVKKSVIYSDRAKKIQVLYDLEQIEFQIIGFGYIHKDGVVGRLLSGLNLAQGNTGIGRGCVKHFYKKRNNRGKEHD